MTGESLGLLVEQVRTNEILYSENVLNSWWNKFALSTPTLVSSVNNPLQNADAYRVRANTSNVSHYLHRQQSNLLDAGTTYTFSALVAPEGLNTEADYGKVRFVFLKLAHLQVLSILIWSQVRVIHKMACLVNRLIPLTGLLVITAEPTLMDGIECR